MMIVTDAASLLGSCMISQLNQKNFNYLIASISPENRNNEEAIKNIEGKKIQEKVYSEDLFAWLDERNDLVEFAFHFQKESVWDKKSDHINSFFATLWQKCIEYQIPLIFAVDSSSQKKVQAWVENQPKKPFFWAALTFSDSFGPYESYRKEDASSIYHLLNSHSSSKEDSWSPAILPSYSVNIVTVAYFFIHHRSQSGFYLLDEENTYTSAELKELIESTQNTNEFPSESRIPESLKSVGYDDTFYSFPSSVSHYYHQYLKK